jgi:hypothetical protein
VAAAAAQIVGGIVAQAAHLELPAIATQIDPATALLDAFFGGVFLAVVLAAFAPRLAVPTVERVGVLFLAILLLNRLLAVIEAVFFTTYFDRGLASTVLVSIVVSLAIAATAARLFSPRQVTTTVSTALGQLGGKRSAPSWSWRILLTGLLYLPTYFVFGQLVYPFVRTYYEDPSLGLGLHVPGAEQIILLEIARGLLFTLALVPIAALLRGAWWQGALALGIFIAALTGWEPLAFQPLWPVALRVAHGLEITGDSLVQGFTLVWLLGHRRPA